jgi:CBS domain-containing protein
MEELAMTTVRQILDNKGHTIFSVRPNDTVEEALQMMAKEDVGAVLVTDDGNLVGIFTERHYARQVFLRGRRSPNTRVMDVMKTEVLSVDPEQTAAECMALMSKNRVRHLPVLSNGRLIGVISIGDIMRSIIAAHEFDIDQMVQYFQGSR